MKDKQQWKEDLQFDRPKPQIDMNAMCALARRINRRMIGFEYGSGASTLWLANRCAKLISVEHKYKWYIRVRRSLDYREIFFNRSAGVIMRYVPVDLKFDKDYVGKDMKSYKLYVKCILDHPRLFDFIIIDGRCRNKCLELAVKKVKRNSLILFDNCQRDVYQKSIKAYLSGWKKVSTFPKTGIWMKL